MTEIDVDAFDKWVRGLMAEEKSWGYSLPWKNTYNALAVYVPLEADLADLDIYPLEFRGKSILYVPLPKPELQ